jgi:hypothetical protein
MRPRTFGCMARNTGTGALTGGIIRIRMWPASARVRLTDPSLATAAARGSGADEGVAFQFRPLHGQYTRVESPSDHQVALFEHLRLDAPFAVIAEFGAPGCTIPTDGPERLARARLRRPRRLAVWGVERIVAHVKILC